MDRRSTLKHAAALAAVSALPVRAQTQTRRVVVGFPPGGTTDIVARLMAEQWNLRGGNYIVDNRAGAAGRLAVEFTKAAPADGTVLLVTPASPLTVYPHTYKTLRYDPLNDFVPVSRLVNYEYALAVGPGSGGANTVAEFVGWAKANPGRGSFASPGAGTAPHLLGAYFGEMAGVRLSHVAYRGTAPAIPDVIGGHVPSIFTVMSDLIPHHRAGKLKIVAMTGRNRSAALPEVPTFGELGMRQLECTDWYGAFAPARTPTGVVAEIQAQINEALKAPAVASRFNELVLQSAPSTTAELAAQMRREVDGWGVIVKAVGFVPED